MCLASLRLRPRAPDPGRSVVVGMLDALAALRAVGTAVVAYADAADEAATACERACGDAAAPAEVEAVAEVRAATRALRQRYSAMVAHPTSSAGLAGAAGAAGAALVHGAGVTPAAALAALASSVQRGLGRGEQGGTAAAETRLQRMADALIRGAWAAGAAGDAARARAGQPAPARADGGGAAAPGAGAGGPAAADHAADGHQVRPGARRWRPARAACAPAQHGRPGALALGRRAAPGRGARPASCWQWARARCRQARTTLRGHGVMRMRPRRTAGAGAGVRWCCARAAAALHSSRRPSCPAPSTRCACTSARPRLARVPLIMRRRRAARLRRPRGLPSVPVSAPGSKGPPCAFSRASRCAVELKCAGRQRASPGLRSRCGGGPKGSTRHRCRASRCF